MNKIRMIIGQNLRRQLLAGGFLALGISIVALFLFWLAIDAALNLTNIGQNAKTYVARHQVDRQFSKLEKYVKDEAVSYDNLTDLEEWCYNQGYQCPALFILDGNQVIYEYTMLLFEEDSIATLDDIEQNLGQIAPDSTAVSRYRDLVLSDGITVTVCLCIYLGGLLETLGISLAIILAFLTFAVVLLLMIRGKIRYLSSLKRELDILAAGDLKYRITERGHDEIWELASGINHMRESILEKQANEEEARQANAELVTAVSHDLRSPLTALIGYLELLKRLPAEKQAETPHLVDSSLEKALQIKIMSDRLFEYFLVSQAETEEVPLESYDAATLIGGMTEDLIFSLETEQFHVSSEMEPITGELNANPELLQRVFDNMYSNLTKYADREEGISIICCTGQNKLFLSVKNSIRRDLADTESTRIGIRTCEKILSAHHGSFLCRQEEDFFYTELRFPLSRS